MPQTFTKVDPFTDEHFALSKWYERRFRRKLTAAQRRVIEKTNIEPPFSQEKVDAVCRRLTAAGIPCEVKLLQLILADHTPATFHIVGDRERAPCPDCGAETFAFCRDQPWDDSVNKPGVCPGRVART